MAGPLKMADHYYNAFNAIICNSQGNKLNAVIGINTANISLMYYAWYLESVLKWESSFVTQIFHNGQPSHGGDNKTFE